MSSSKTKTEQSPPDEGGTSAEVSARRLKKREIDRKCQRQARERTRSRIAHLESLVENLQQADADERNAALLKRLADVEKERDVLASTLKGVQKAIFGMDALDDTPSLRRETSDLEPATTSNIDMFASNNRRDHSLTDVASSPTSPTMGSVPPHTDIGPSSQNTRNMSFSTQAEPLRPELPIHIQNDTCDCCRVANPPNHHTHNYWRVANDTLMTNFKRLSPILPEEDILAEDIPVRAIVEGWDSVSQEMELPASWKIMRRIDEQLFKKSGLKERLAILRTLHLMLQYHRDPTAERRARVPPWYHQRPSQARPHAYATNYFVWPGVRERFVFEQHKYCNNLFATLFQTCLNIMWPYDFRDCFVQRWDTGHYELSTGFRDTINDISKWTMAPDFLNQFPDLRGDIPQAYTSPQPISNALQLQLASHAQRSQQHRPQQQQQSGRLITPMPSRQSSNKQTPLSSDGAASTQMSMAEGWIPQAAMVDWNNHAAFAAQQEYMDQTLQSGWSAG
jgi:hypothetical protein